MHLFLALMIGLVARAEAGLTTQSIHEQKTYTAEDAQQVDLEFPDFRSSMETGVQLRSLRSSAWANNALLDAVAVTSLANKKYPSPLFQLIINKSSSTNVVIPDPGKDFKGCTKDVLAFVIRGTTTIHICNLPIAIGFRRYAMAQILIHEMAHVIGIHDECQATVVEESAMVLSGLGLQFKNSYKCR